MEDRKILSSVLRGVDITEVYSPQRVVDVCHKYQLIKGDSFDLRTGFDLSDPAVQQRVSKRIVETDAVLVILSPPCTKFSTLQALNLHINGPEWAAAFAVEKEKAIAHIEYSINLAKLQIARGAYFLFDHPAHATSWELPCIKEVRKMTGVVTVVGDMCMYGLTTLSEDRKSMVPAKKPSQFYGQRPVHLGRVEHQMRQISPASAPHGRAGQQGPRVQL